jgi:uncharacterized OB-fold protein
MSETLNVGFESDAYAAAYPETRPFWEAAAEGRLLVKACRACGRAHWYPKVVCPFCRSTDLEWRQASGRGTVYTYSVMRRVEVPYVLAYVTLEEGPTLMTNIVDCDVDAVRIGQAVQVRFRPAPQGRSVPVFAPA